MTIRNILCAYSGEEARHSGLRYSIKIAQHHGGFLTGVVSHAEPELKTRYGTQLPPDVIEILLKTDKERVQEIADRFLLEIANADFTDRSDFIELTDRFGTALDQFARSFDLVVTGVHSGDLARTHLAANPDLIALRSGRPVLVVPNDYEGEQLTEHALVAWDGKRSAARALGDAMPILEEKAKVTVLTVGKQPPEGLERLLLNLERHGINAHSLHKTKLSSVGRTVLQAVEDQSAQLLVMGAYEHSKFSHDLFGGVTTDVLKASPVPVFLSH